MTGRHPTPGRSPVPGPHAHRSRFGGTAAEVCELRYRHVREQAGATQAAYLVNYLDHEPHPSVYDYALDETRLADRVLFRYPAELSRDHALFRQDAVQ